VRIGRLTIHRGQVQVEDHSRPKPFAATLAPIEFSLTDFRTEPKFENAYRFAASTPDKETLEWSGEFSVEPLGSKGRFTLTNIKATTIASYLQDALPFDLRSGLLDVQGNYALALQDRVDLRVQLPSIKATNFELGVRATEPAPPWVVVPELTISGSALSLADRKVTVDSVHVSDAVIDAWRETDGTLNLARLTASTSKTVEPATKESSAAISAAPWTVGVQSIQVERARINVEDRSVKPIAKFALTPIDLKLNNYSSNSNSTLGIESSIGINERGHLTTIGTLALSPVVADLKIALSDFDLAVLQPYVAQATDLTIRRGSASLQTAVQFSSEPKRGQAQLKITGDAEISELLTQDNALKQDLVKWQSLKLTGLDFQQRPNKLNIARITVRKPYGRVIIGNDGTLNIAQVLNPSRKQSASATPSVPADQPKAAAQSPQPSMPMRIRNVIVEDGTASFADYSVNPSFATDIAALNGTVEGLSSDADSRAKVQLSGSVDKYSPVSISGELNLLATTKFSDIAMSFRNMDLTTFNPYSGKFAGYNITKGKLSTELHYKVNDRALDATHHIVIDQLEFGAATESKDAVSLPVKLAVALLKDRNGVIKLDLPIAGNLDDPKFRIGPIVWQVLKNTLEKIVTAPFALLGSLFGGGEELAFVDFQPGSAALDAAQLDKLGKVSQALVERPQLKLDVPLQIVADVDGPTIAHAALEQSLAPLLQKNSDRATALAVLFTREMGKAPVYPEASDKVEDKAAAHARFLEDELLQHFTATPAQKEELARNRGNAVRDAVLANKEISPERIFLSGRALDPKSPKNANAVRMELKLE
jgi:hypothetical protein